MLIKDYTSRCTAIVSENQQMAVPWFLMSGYVYENLHENLISDDLYDSLARYIDENYDKMTHRHIFFIKRDALSTATAQYMTEDYLPTLIKEAAKALVKEMRL